jgi:cyclase
MNICNRLMLCASFAALQLMGSSALAQPAPVAPRAAAPVTVKELKPGIYMAVGGGGNSTFQATRNGVTLVDTKNMGEDQYKALLDAIKTVTPKKVVFVFDTHHHADHTGNNEFFERDGAKVIGQGSMVEAFKGYVSTLAPHTPANPNALFQTRYTVRLGGQTAIAYHWRGGHTGNDAVIYFPEAKVVAGGDLLDMRVPNYDAPYGGSLRGYSQSLGDILKLDFDYAVPGHGDEAWTKAQVQAYKDKIDAVIERATALVKAGTPKEKFIDTINAETGLAWKLGGQFWAPMPRLDALYAELSKAPGA